MIDTVNKDARDHTLASTAWKAIIQDYDIMDEISRKGYSALVLKQSKNIVSPA